MTSALQAPSPIYRGRRVLVTGHTGFKGSWLALWLAALGAHVTGFALAPEEPSFFLDGEIDRLCDHVIGDVRDRSALAGVIDRADPEVVFHLAAQPIVRLGYTDPLGTFSTNILGTLNLLEALRTRGRPCALVVVTSDKCYRPSPLPHVESDPLEGDDPYSASKAACEMVVGAYRASFFPPARLDLHRIAVASARAGNVVGGGDWAQNRIVPDVVRSLLAGSPVQVRNPDHVRPWQHVLEPLSGYLMLGAGLLGGIEGIRPAELCGPWNFGPLDEADRTVREVVEAFLIRWGSGLWELAPSAEVFGEVPCLRLSIQKSRQRLAWTPRWSFGETIDRTADWYRAYAAGRRGEGLRRLTLDQIDDYLLKTTAA